MPPLRNRVTDPPQPLRFVAWVGLVVAAAYVMTAGGTYPGIASVQARMVVQVIAYAVLGAWLVVAVPRPAWRPTTPLLLPVALASGAYVLSALLSQRPRLSLEPTFAGLGFALAFLLLTRLLAHPWFRPRVEGLIPLATAIVAVGYIGQVVALWVEWWGLVGRLALPPLRPDFAGFVFGSPNLVATFLFIVAPVGVVIVWERTGRTGLAAALALAVGVAIFLTGSRGAYLGVGLGFAVGVALLVDRAGARAILEQARSTLRTRPILLAPIAVLALAALVVAPLVAYRFAQGGDSLRIDLWRSALTIFADHPLTGGGPGTWVQLKVPANPPGVPNVIVPHAHDMYVQAAAELGVVGLVALAVLVVAVGRRLWLAWRSTDRHLGLRSAAVTVGLAAFAGQSIVDNLVNLPFVCLGLVTIVALVEAGLSPWDAPRAGDRLGRLAAGPYLPAALLAVLVLLVPILVRIDAAGLDEVAGNDAALAGDWPTALAHYEAALATDPDLTLYRLQRASALARVGRAADARAELEAAVADDPVGINVVGLATLDLAIGGRPAALDRARRAAELAVGDATVALNAGIVGERAGDRAFALDEFADAVAWDPPLASSAFWTDPKRVVPKAEVVARARSRTDPLTAALVLAYAGDPVTARAGLAAQPPSSTRDVYLAAASWLGGDTATAQASLASMTDADPLDWFAAAWMARISRLSGDQPTADRYARWATIVQADSAPFAIDEASVVPAGPGDATTGLPPNYPWAVYLRPITPYLLIPQATLIGTR